MSRPITDQVMRQRMIEGAKRYAAADRSDPFAFNRAMTHINNGVAGLLPNGEDGFYNALEGKNIQRV